MKNDPYILFAHATPLAIRFSLVVYIEWLLFSTWLEALAVTYYHPAYLVIIYGGMALGVISGFFALWVSLGHIGDTISRLFSPSGETHDNRAASASFSFVALILLLIYLASI